MAEARETAQALIRNAHIEVIPIKGADRAVAEIPVTTTVTITCSPKFGLERTIDHVARAAGAGYRVVPHLAARQVRDRRELQEIVSRFADVGVRDLYVVGGDASTPEGEFDSAAHLLTALAELEHPFSRIGVACYPEGHQHIDERRLMEALLAKQDLAHYMVSQLCFDPASLVSWLRAARAAGVTLPLNVGLAAPLNSRKLLELSLKIGVGSSVKFLSKQHGLMNNLVLGRDYEPEVLLTQIVEQEAFGDLGIGGLHLFSFNQIERTLQWQRTQCPVVPA